MSGDSGPSDCDAIVVGAGPAGATAATLLARRGWSVTLIDRAPAGHVKCCGNCLSGAALPLLEAMGLKEVVDAATVGELRSLRLDVAVGGCPDPRSITVALPSERAGRLIDRARLDRGLADLARSAGVRVIRPCSVVKVESQVAEGGGAGRFRRAAAGGLGGPPWRVTIRRQASAGAHGTEVLGCGLLVGADGLGSGVARRFGWEDPSAGRAFGFSTDVPRGLVPEVAEGEIWMHVMEGGYLALACGKAALGALACGKAARAGAACGGVHVGAFVRGGAARRDPRSFMAEIARRFPSMAGLAEAAAELECVGAGPMPWRPRQVAAAGVALVGDAASYVEPFTGEGMAWAFESAALLGQAMEGGGARNGVSFDARAAGRYRRAWMAAIGRRQRRCGLVAKVVRRPTVLAAGVRAVPGMARAMVRWVGEG